MDNDQNENVKVIYIVLISIVVFAVLLLFFARGLAGLVTKDQPIDPLQKRIIAERLQPVFAVNTSTTPPVTAKAQTPQKAQLNPEKIYSTRCSACHQTGVMGAPRMGHKEEWESRMAQGMEMLTAHAMEGFQGKKGYMPPNAGLDKQQIVATITYMLSQSEVEFETE